MNKEQLERIVGQKRKYIDKMDSIDAQYVELLEHEYKILFNMLYKMLIIHKDVIPMRFISEYEDFWKIQNKRNY